MVYSDVKKELLNNPTVELVEEVLDEILDIYGDFINCGIMDECTLADWANENPDFDECEIYDLFLDCHAVAEYLMETSLEPLMNAVDKLIQDFE